MLKYSKYSFYANEPLTTHGRLFKLMIDLSQRYQRNDSFVYRRIENETILVPIKDNVGDMGSIYNLNEMGALVWEHLDGEHNLETIKNMVLDDYDVSSGEAERDLSEFLTDLIEIEAVRLVD
jgi:hypothetical protein